MRKVKKTKRINPTKTKGKNELCSVYGNFTN
jgi:hypothetical protein